MGTTPATPSNNLTGGFAPIPTPADAPRGISDPTIGWLTEAVQESEAFIAAQPGFDQIAKAFDAIMSLDETDVFDPRSSISQTKTNRVAKIGEDIAALLTDTKPFWEYSIDNRRFEQQAQVYGKLATHWYSLRNIDLRLADAIKYYVAAGTGYVNLFYSPEISDIYACAEDPRNVLPIRPVDYTSLESCLGVILKRKVPVNYIKDRYGYDAKADSDGSAVSWLNKMRDSVADVVSPIWKYRKSGRSEPDIPRIPTATLYTCWIKDNRRNESVTPRYMGEWKDGKPQNNWSYKVEKGEELFPLRRMMMWVGNHMIYDGPSMYWHGQFPIHKLTLNPWPMSWLGKAPTWDLLRLQTSMNRLLRVVDDHASQVAQPGSIHDKNSVSASVFESFDTRRAGWKIRQNPLAGKGIQIVNPPPLDPGIMAQIEWIMNEMKELSGITDMGQMMDLGQVPSTSTVEAIIKSMTPALRFRSRIMEAFTRDFAMQLAYNFSQFYTLPMRVAILGPGGATQDDFDFDPGSLIPDYVHSGDYKDGKITAEAFERGPLPRYDRAREFLRRFTFKISPGSLLNAAQVEQRLIYLQLARAGWMDVFTLWEILGIPNIGVLPDNVRTIPDRLIYQQSLGLTGDVNPAGRKASGQEIPRLVTKES
jgi:hypothetical protein